MSLGPTEGPHPGSPSLPGDPPAGRAEPLLSPQTKKNERWQAPENRDNEITDLRLCLATFLRPIGTHGPETTPTGLGARRWSR